jgi:predicted nucleic acid-binding protein
LIFVDTGFFFALFSKRDEHHTRVLEVFREFRGQRLPELLLTKDQVVIETITLTRMRLSHEAAVFAGERLYGEKIARIHETTLEEHKAAFDYLRKHTDKDYSPVDCLSFVVMEKLGMKEALAVDSDFTHRFTARPGPKPR